MVSSWLVLLQVSHRMLSALEAAHAWQEPSQLTVIKDLNSGASPKEATDFFFVLLDIIIALFKGKHRLATGYPGKRIHHENHGIPISQVMIFLRPSTLDRAGLPRG